MIVSALGAGETQALNFRGFRLVRECGEVVMELYYCDVCGLRIKSGDGKVGADFQRYCEPCFAKQFPTNTPPSSASFKIATPLPFKLGPTPLPGSLKVGPTPLPGTLKLTHVSANESSARRKTATIPARAAAKETSTTLVAAIGGGAVALVVVAFIAFGRSSSDHVAATEKLTEKPRETKTDSARVAVVLPSESLKRLEKLPQTIAPLPASIPQTEKSQAQIDRRAVPDTTRALPPAQPQKQALPPALTTPPDTARAGGGSAVEEILQKKQEDFRENLAQRRLDELLTEEVRGMRVMELREQLMLLVQAHPDTAAGRKAVEKLKTMPQPVQTVEKPAADTVFTGGEISGAEQANLLLGGTATDKSTSTAGSLPPAQAATAAALPEAAAAAVKADAVPAAQVLWKNSFNSDDEWKGVTGSREKVQTGGEAVKASGGKIELIMDGVKLGATSWIRFSYRLTGGSDFSLQADAAGATYEKFVFGAKTGKWHKYTFKFNAFDKCVTKKNESQPAAGAALTRFAIQLPGGAMLIDDVTIGDGAIPEE